MYPVYLISCINDNQFRGYVGCILSANTLNNRLKQHWQEKRKPYLFAAMHKHGLDRFQIEQIDAGNTPEQALWLEAWWIKRLGTKAPLGYNLTDGGQGTVGRKHSPEARKRMSDAKKGISPWNKGKVTGALSAQHRSNIANACKGRTLSEEAKQHLRELSKRDGRRPPWAVGKGK